MHATTKKTAFIATLPKSGTWYTKIFFWYYEQLLADPEAYLSRNATPDIAPALAKLRVFNDSEHKQTLGIDRLYIVHSSCPGFTPDIGDALYTQWQALQFPATGHNNGEWYARNMGIWDSLNPAANPDVKIVYLYRNPLDHFVSYYEYMLNHIGKKYSSKLLPDGTSVPFDDLQDFVFHCNGLSGFIKHYYAYRQMQALFSSQILMMPYEHLTTDPRRSFYAILSFLGAAPKNATEERLLDAALSLSSKKALMNLESRLDISLAGDQHPGGRHIRDGSIGKWKAHFSEHDIEAVESVMQLFRMTLNDFILDEEGESLPWLEKMDAARKQPYQIQFLQQQLGLVGMGVRTEIVNVMLSRSWRITEPLRLLSKIVHNLKYSA